MAENKQYITQEQDNGKVMISEDVIHTIIESAVAEVEGTVAHNQSKKSAISLYIEKDGVYVDVSVVVKYGYNVPELAYRIQQTIKQSVENMTNYKVAEVDVHILDVVFDDQPMVEKEPEPHEEEELPMEEQEQNK